MNQINYKTIKHGNGTTPYIFTVDFAGFLILIYFLWEKNILYALLTWAFTKFLILSASVIFVDIKMNYLNFNDEDQKTLFLLSKSIATLVLYYGVWTHSLEKIALSIIAFIIIYFLNWLSVNYSEK